MLDPTGKDLYLPAFFPVGVKSALDSFYHSCSCVVGGRQRGTGSRERGGAFGMHGAWSRAHRVNGFAHCSANAEERSLGGIDEGFPEGFITFSGTTDAVLLGQVFYFYDGGHGYQLSVIGYWWAEGPVNSYKVIRYLKQLFVISYQNYSLTDYKYHRMGVFL